MDFGKLLTPYRHHVEVSLLSSAPMRDCHLESVNLIKDAGKLSEAATSSARYYAKGALATWPYRHRALADVEVDIVRSRSLSSVNLRLRLREHFSDLADRLGVAGALISIVGLLILSIFLRDPARTLERSSLVWIAILPISGLLILGLATLWIGYGAFSIKRFEKNLVARLRILDDLYIEREDDPNEGNFPTLTCVAFMLFSLVLVGVIVWFHKYFGLDYTGHGLLLLLLWFSFLEGMAILLVVLSQGLPSRYLWKAQIAVASVSWSAILMLPIPYLHFTFLAFRGETGCGSTSIPMMLLAIAYFVAGMQLRYDIERIGRMRRLSLLLPKLQEVEVNGDRKRAFCSLARGYYLVLSIGTYIFLGTFCLTLLRIIGADRILAAKYLVAVSSLFLLPLGTVFVLWLTRVFLVIHPFRKITDNYDASERLLDSLTRPGLYEELLLTLNAESLGVWWGAASARKCFGAGICSYGWMDRHLELYLDKRVFCVTSPPEREALIWHELAHVKERKNCRLIDLFLFLFCYEHVRLALNDPLEEEREADAFVATHKGLGAQLFAAFEKLHHFGFIERSQSGQTSNYRHINRILFGFPLGLDWHPPLPFRQALLGHIIDRD